MVEYDEKTLVDQLWVKLQQSEKNNLDLETKLVVAAKVVSALSEALGKANASLEEIKEGADSGDLEADLENGAVTPRDDGGDAGEDETEPLQPFQEGATVV